MTININKTTQIISVSDTSKPLKLNAISGVVLPSNNYKNIELVSNNTGFMDISPVSTLTFSSSSGSTVQLNFNKRLHYVSSDTYNSVLLSSDIEYLKEHITTGVNYQYENAIDRVETLEAASQLNIGSIIMWSGTTAPAGYAFCDGRTQNGTSTPDLRNRFIISARVNSYGRWLGYNPFRKSSLRVRDVGGDNTHSVTIAEMPSHKHVIPWGEASTDGAPWGYTGAGRPGSKGGWDYDNIWRYSSPPYAHTAGLGSNQIPNLGTAHENRPPFYSLAYLMYVGT